MEKSTTSQDKILYQIKRLGPQSAKSLAQAMEISTMGIRQHLKHLSDEGLIKALPEQPQPRGRPVKSWKLTEKGHSRFPDAHAQVTADLILSVRELLGEDAMQTIVEKRTQDTYEHYHSSMASLKTLRDKVEELVKLRSEEGYMAEVVEEEDHLLFLEHHCPICIAAKTCQGFCQSELEVFQKLFQETASVVREDHILNGARRCSYRIIQKQ
jgi:predicted ArsR family transcriptional regulator